MTETTTAPTQTPEPISEQWEDYWGTDERVNHYLPDGKQYFVLQVMNEGAKVKFQKMTTQDVVLDQRSGNAKFKMDPATERHELIRASVKDWLLYKQGVKQPFSERNLSQWLSAAPPKLVEDLEFAIRKLNPWLQNDMTVEQIDEEMNRLRELRSEKEKEAAGEGDSANK